MHLRLCNLATPSNQILTPARPAQLQLFSADQLWIAAIEIKTRTSVSRPDATNQSLASHSTPHTSISPHLLRAMFACARLSPTHRASRSCSTQPPRPSPLLRLSLSPPLLLSSPPHPSHISEALIIGVRGVITARPEIKSLAKRESCVCLSKKKITK